MTDTEKMGQYFDTLEDLFKHPGWKLFCDDIGGNQQALKEAALSNETEKGFYIAKGRNQTFNQVLGYEDLIKSAHSAFLGNDD